MASDVPFMYGGPFVQTPAPQPLMAYSVDRPSMCQQPYDMRHVADPLPARPPKTKRGARGRGQGRKRKAARADGREQQLKGGKSKPTSSVPPGQHKPKQPKLETKTSTNTKTIKSDLDGTTMGSSSGKPNANVVALESRVDNTKSMSCGRPEHPTDDVLGAAPATLKPTIDVPVKPRLSMSSNGVHNGTAPHSQTTCVRTEEVSAVDNTPTATTTPTDWKTLRHASVGRVEKYGKTYELWPQAALAEELHYAMKAWRQACKPKRGLHSEKQDVNLEVAALQVQHSSTSRRPSAVQNSTSSKDDHAKTEDTLHLLQTAKSKHDSDVDLYRKTLNRNGGIAGQHLYDKVGKEYDVKEHCAHSTVETQKILLKYGELLAENGRLRATIRLAFDS